MSLPYIRFICLYHSYKLQVTQQLMSTKVQTDFTHLYQNPMTAIHHLNLQIYINHIRTNSGSGSTYQFCPKVSANMFSYSTLNLAHKKKPLPFLQPIRTGKCHSN